MSLRTAAIGCRLQPSLATPCTYHTTARPPSRSQDEQNFRARVPLTKTSTPFTPQHSLVRCSSSVSPPASSETSPSATTSTQPHDRLDWNTFFKLRKNRRRLQLGSSVGTSLASMVGGAQVIARSDMDAIVGQIPLDPFITLGLITFGCGGVGWLLGPIVGTGIFNMANGKHRTEMAAREKEFYSRIKKYRVDPSASSMANPVPDYYGERISSVQGYRQWLKDQRAFNKKRQTFV